MLKIGDVVGSHGSREALWIVKRAEHHLFHETE
jgi:hypothetical protein